MAHDDEFGDDEFGDDEFGDDDADDMDVAVEAVPDLDVGWTPATSKPGELFTPEGRIKAFGSMASGLTTKDPRRIEYRNRMIRTGVGIIVAGIGIMVVFAIVVAMVD